MKNIERFNLYTAYLFGTLYEQFPIARAIDESEVVRALKLPPQEASEGIDPASEENKLVTQTLEWLVDTGYLIKRVNAASVERYVLAPKAFEALNAKVSALEGNAAVPGEESVGQKLAAAATNASREAGKETLRQFAAQIVGLVIGHAAKAWTGSP
jgi:hypothetical protein